MSIISLNLKLQSFTRHVLRGDLHLDVGRTDFLEAGGHDAVGEFGLVALAAQVREVKMLQLGGHDLRGGFGGGFVGQMAVAAEDALLEAPRTARTILQHLGRGRWQSQNCRRRCAAEIRPDPARRVEWKTFRCPHRRFQKPRRFQTIASQFFVSGVPCRRGRRARVFSPIWF